ncbi:MAG TPA: GAF domain-containing protein [Methylomirabilota bacterium]|nr:GAF domain-containing protein [Methylomirabilota bacterium]
MTVPIPSRPTRGVKILHIEDNPDNRVLVRALLEAEGYTVVEAEDGLSGIEVALREEPALVLLDINLPGVDGYEVGVILKSFPSLGVTPVIAVTAYAMEGDRQRTLVAGCDGYIQKPIDVDQFPRQVEEFLRGKRERVDEVEAGPYLRELNQRLVYRLISQVEELKRLNQHFVRRAVQLEDLHEAVQDITAELGLAPMLERLLRALARALGTVSLTVELTDPAGMRVTAAGTPFERGAGVLGATVADEWVEVEWSLPLNVRGRALGTLTARHVVPPGARSDEEQLLKIVANQLAIAVENTRLYTETQARLRQTETLLGVSQAVGSALTIAEAARRTTEALVRALGADVGGAWQLTPARDRLIPLGGYRVPKEVFAAAAETLPASGSVLLEQMLRGQGPIYASDSTADPRFDHPLLRLLPHKSALVVPMRVKDEVLGGFAVAWLHQHHEFRPEELRLVEGIARQAAVAIDNARLLEAERETRDRLAASQTRYRELFENVIDIVYLHDFMGRLLEVNEAAVRASGYPRDELLTMSVHDLVAREEQERVIQMVGRLASGERQVESLVAEFVNRDGARLILEAVGRVVVQDGRPAAILVSARDVTVRRRLERRQETLVALSRELASEIDLERLLPRIVEEARRLIGMHSALLLLLEDDELVLRGASAVDEAMLVPGELGATPNLLRIALRERRPLVYANLAADPAWRPTRLVGEFGYRAMLAVPLTVKERTLGILQLLHREPRQFALEEIEFLRALATQAALAIENARLFAARREEAEISAGLLRLAKAIEGVQELDEVLTTVVRTTTDLVGRRQCLLFLLDPVDQSLLPRAAAGLPPEHRPAFESLRDAAHLPSLSAALRSQDPVTLDDAGPDAQQCPALAAVLGLRAMLLAPMVSGGRVLGALGIHTPGSREVFSAKEVALARGIAAHAAVAIDKARLFQQTQIRLRETETLLNITKAVSSTLDPTETMRRVAREIARTLGADMVGAYLADATQEALHPIAGYRVPRELYDDFLRFPIPIKGHPAIEEAWQRRQAVWSNDAPGDPRIHRPSFDRFPHQSLLFVPMIVKAQPIGGFFVIWWTERRDFRPDEIRIVEAISDQAAMFMENARLYSEATRQRREAEELARLARMLTQSLDAADVGERIVESALALLGGSFSVLRLLQPDGTLKLIAAKGDAQTIAVLPAVAPAREGVVGQAVAQGAPVWSASIGEEELAVPLRVKREIIGALGVGASPGRRFTEAEVALVQTFADQAATALENSRLYGDLRTALQAVEESQRRIVQGERLRALGEMAGGVAHDFNNVLAIIVGRAEVLLSETEDLDLQRQLNVIVKVALDAAQTVKRIQEFTRVRRARPFQQVTLHQLVEEIVEVTRSRWKDEAQSKGIRYEVVVEAGVTPVIAGDPSEIREALTNIIFNALDAMPEGGRLTLTTGVDEGRVFCAITDTGIGMSDDVRQRIFDPFFTTKGERGTGLGLSVVYGIIGRHNGEIDVQSRAGQGTTFTLRFPTGEPADRETVAAIGTAPLKSSGRILVIDDETDVGDVLRDLLTRDGHSVVVCHDAEAGLRQFQAEAFDLVITDLGMPEVSGWEVARQVKLARPETRVAMVTGWGDRIDLAEAEARGVDFVVAKPFKRDQIREVIAAALGGVPDQRSSPAGT